MKIELNKIPIQHIVLYSKYIDNANKCTGYIDKGEDGVYGMDGRLNIRPPYQREFVYKDKQREAVINSILKEFPLNTLYFAVNIDGTYEVIDGQQRLISICQYTSGMFTINKIGFNNLTENEQNQILNYELMVYFCEGTDKEKLEWFRTINIAGEKLTDQELRNAVYCGTWVGDAKRYFSRNACVAYDIGRNYLKGSTIRQEYLETVIKWISGGDIEAYMAEHQHNKDAKELWVYFENVIDWVKKIFPYYRKEMKGIPWGFLYNEFKNNEYNTKEIESKVNDLMLDEDVTKKSGIYTYIFTGAEKELSIRTFTEANIREAYEKQERMCIRCGKKFDIDDMEADHITPWSKGGKTIPKNCQMLCLDCNRRKSNK